MLKTIAIAISAVLCMAFTAVPLTNDYGIDCHDDQGITTSYTLQNATAYPTPPLTGDYVLEDATNLGDVESFELIEIVENPSAPAANEQTQETVYKVEISISGGKVKTYFVKASAYSAPPATGRWHLNCFLSAQIDDGKVIFGKKAQAFVTVDQVANIEVTLFFQGS